MEEKCPKCESANIYQDGNMWICPDCSNEWIPLAAGEKKEEKIADDSVRDANGAILLNGDSVIVIKDLKIKGSSSSIKSGTKVRNIRLSDGGDGHNIAAKIDGLGSINLKSEFVKKV